MNTMENETEISIHFEFYVSIDGHIFIFIFALSSIQMYLLSYSDFGSYSPSQVAEFGTTHMYDLIWSYYQKRANLQTVASGQATSRDSRKLLDLTKKWTSIKWTNKMQNWQFSHKG